MFEDDNIRIRHILDAVREAVAFAKGRSRAACQNDEKMYNEDQRVIESSLNKG